MMKLKQIFCDHIYEQQYTVDLKILDMGVLKCKKCEKFIFFKPLPKQVKVTSLTPSERIQMDFVDSILMKEGEPNGSR